MKIIKVFVLISFFLGFVFSINTSKGSNNKDNVMESTNHKNEIIVKQDSDVNEYKEVGTSFLQVQEQLSTKSEAKATVEATVSATAESKAQSGVTAQLSLKMRAAKAVEDAEKIAQQFKKEIEEYAKIKKARKPVKVDNSQEAQELQFIQKNSMSKYLPENINQKLNEFRLE